MPATSSQWDTLRPGVRALLGSRHSPVWPAGRAGAAAPAGRPAGSPAGPLFSPPGLTRRGSELLQQQEPVRQERQGCVVVEPPPRPPLEVVQPEFLLQLLVPLFDRPPALPEPNRCPAARVGRQVGQGELELPV